MNKSQLSPLHEKNHFPIIGIGTSAGGLEALEQFFTNMPRTAAWHSW